MLIFVVKFLLHEYTSVKLFTCKIYIIYTSTMNKNNSFIREALVCWLT